MNENIISIAYDDNLAKALNIFDRYSFRAIVVIGKNEKLIWVVLYMDIVGFKYKWHIKAIFVT